jgi:hypothetical protein
MKNKLHEILKIVETLNSQDLEALTVIISSIRTGRTLKTHKLKSRWIEARKDLHPACKT